MVGWLDDWMIGWLDDWTIGRLDDWTIGRLDDWMIGQKGIDCPTHSSYLSAESIAPCLAGPK
jgi:hypothetical protein